MTTKEFENGLDFITNFAKSIEQIPQDKQTFFYWKYSDNSEAGVLLKTYYYNEDEKKYKLLGIQRFLNKKQRKRYVRHIRDLAKRKGVKQKKEIIALKYTLVQREISKVICEENFWAEFQRMLFSCGKDHLSQTEVLRLVSGILVSYTVPLFEVFGCFEENSAQYHYPPILSVSYNLGLWEILSKFLHSLAIEYTANPDDATVPLEAHIPVILPSTFKPEKRNMLDDAGFFYLGGKNPRLLKVPVEYPRTAILIDASAYSSRQILEFQSRNRHACIVLYHSRPGKHTPSSADPIVLAPKLLANCDLDWDANIVYKIIVDFKILISRAVKGELDDLGVQASWEKAEKYLQCYHAQRGIKKLRPSSSFYICLQLATLDIFLTVSRKNGFLGVRTDFGYDRMGLDSCEILDEWANLLLPGCCKRPASNVPLNQRTSIGEADYREVFEEVIRRMITIENINRILPVPEKGLFDRTNPEDESFSYWGYIRKYLSPKEPMFFALQFDESCFYQFATPFLPVQVDLKEIIKVLRKDSLPYLHTSNKARMPENNEDGRVYNCIVLRVDDMKFLDKDIRDVLKRSLEKQK